MLIDEIKLELNNASEEFANIMAKEREAEEQRKKQYKEAYADRIKNQILNIPVVEFEKLKGIILNYYFSEEKMNTLRNFFIEQIDFEEYSYDQFHHRVDDEKRMAIFHEFAKRFDEINLSYTEKQIILPTLLFLFKLNTFEFVIDAMPFVLELLEKDALGERKYDQLNFFLRYKKRNLIGDDKSLDEKLFHLLTTWYQEKGRELYDLEHHPMLDDPEEGINIYAELRYLFDEATDDCLREKYLIVIQKKFEAIKNRNLDTRDYYLELFDLYNQARRATGEY